MKMPPRVADLETSATISALGIVAPPPIHVTTDTFDGSLATLFGLVRAQKIDLLEVPLLPICEAYFEYLMQARDASLDEAAAALAALSFLLERKAWRLIPIPEVEPEPYEESEELGLPSIGEYHLAISALEVWHEARSGLFFRSPDAEFLPYEVPVVLANARGVDLARALERLLRRSIPTEMPDLSRARKSLAGEMSRVYARLGVSWICLAELVGDFSRREDAVYGFLAILELLRLGDAELKIDGEEPVFRRGNRVISGNPIRDLAQ